ncbi:MAG: 30S ribosome-binding factor RbfA [Planctomycetia bacterium]
MSTRRTARVASMIREVVSTAILSELRDPRIRNVTVLGADVTPDLRYARIRISVMGDEKTAALTMHGLNSAKGYLQSRVGAYIKSRYTPELRFLLDDGIRKSVEMSAMLREVLEDTGGVDPETIEDSGAEVGSEMSVQEQAQNVAGDSGRI